MRTTGGACVRVLKLLLEVLDWWHGGYPVHQLAPGGEECWGCGFPPLVEGVGGGSMFLDNLAGGPPLC